MWRNHIHRIITITKVAMRLRDGKPIIYTKIAKS